MKAAIEFMRELHSHNEKPWFDAHKDWYREAKAEVDALASDMIKGIRSFDSSIPPMGPSDCVYRIYRDLRFSKDKTPYKDNMGFYICRDGKKSTYGGYYFQIGSPANPHMLAIGAYMPTPKELKVIREDIMMGEGDFREILSRVDPRLKFDTYGALKKVPKGFPDGTPDSEFYKLKRFLLYMIPDEKILLGKDPAGQLCAILKTAKPFLDYVNRALDFCKEETKEYFTSFDF
ncbi:MAG: DUF2461 domain-containing protein [Bacteroidales bacterium]|nr:DUF2461 domain-containing protein [Bacteroidales bacterium]MBR1433603.1 DUF2461 domain-containing protein [Bacteroidales bacterium]